jgi:cytochrome c
MNRNAMADKAADKTSTDKLRGPRRRRRANRPGFGAALRRGITTGALSLLLVFTGFGAMAADAGRGAKIFAGDCVECHTLRADEPAKRGPHLEGLLERRYGSVESFPYRMVWDAADPVWTAKHLDDYLVIHGRTDAQGRADLIEYLKKATRK